MPSRRHFSKSLLKTLWAGSRRPACAQTMGTDRQESHARGQILVGWAPPTGLSSRRGGRCPPYENPEARACITFLTLSKPPWPWADAGLLHIINLSISNPGLTPMTNRTHRHFRDTAALLAALVVACAITPDRSASAQFFGRGAGGHVG